MDEWILYGARVLNGLLAGVYVAFLVAVMPALHGLPDDVFARVMNRINEVIVNPAFLLLFLGAPLLAGVLLVWERGPLAIAAAVCAVAALGITFAANLPLNDALAAGGSRQAYETPWLVWHSVRTLAATAAFVLVGLAGR
ncbi:anthrone oxygenase family protein [Nocardioides sp. WV_118_6]